MLLQCKIIKIYFLNVPICNQWSDSFSFIPGVLTKCSVCMKTLTDVLGFEGVQQQAAHHTVVSLSGNFPFYGEFALHDLQHGTALQIC